MGHDLRDGRALVDLDAELLDERGQAEQQLHGVDPCDMGGEARAERPRDPHAGRQLRCADLVQPALEENLATEVTEHTEEEALEPGGKI